MYFPFSQLFFIPNPQLNKRLVAQTTNLVLKPIYSILFVPEFIFICTTYIDNLPYPKGKQQDTFPDFLTCLYSRKLVRKLHLLCE